MSNSEFSANLPWQRICAQGHAALSFRFNQSYDESLLVQELVSVLSDYQPQVQHGKYHDGGWKAVGLITANGDWQEDRLIEGASYGPTEALQKAPYMRELIEDFPGEKKRVRLMNLKAGKSIFWHYDRTDSMDIHTARVHIPIITSSAVRFQICNENQSWKPGEAWYGDFSFPHRLYNAGDRDRIHLVLDIVRSPELEADAPLSFREQLEARRRLRRKAQSAFHQWSLFNRNGSPRTHAAGLIKTWLRANESAPA